MKYLDKTPFSSKPSTDSYRKGWERVFTKPLGKRYVTLRKKRGKR